MNGISNSNTASSVSMQSVKVAARLLAQHKRPGPDVYVMTYAVFQELRAWEKKERPNEIGLVGDPINQWHGIPVEVLETEEQAVKRAQDLFEQGKRVSLCVGS